MERRPRFLVHLLALIAVLGLWSAPAAHAADDQPSSWRIQRYDQTVTLDRSGTAAVTLDLYFDFANDAGRGPYLWFPLRQEIADDPDRWRTFDIDVKSVTSTTGASTELKKDTQDGNLVLRVGSENRKDRRGVQHYRIDYTIRGIVQPGAGSGLDELNWNAVGLGWKVPIDAATVRLTGPAPAERTACFQGRALATACTAGAAASTVEYSAGPLRKGEGVQVVAGYPLGTFVGAEPTYAKRYHPGNMFPASPLSLGLTGGLSAAGLVALLLLVSRNRDRAYVGQIPGLTPRGAQSTQIGRATRGPVAVQFTPPRDARPGEIGTLIDGSADSKDATATLIDLAVRGHVRITELGKKKWQFERLDTDDQTNRVEEKMLAALFAKGRTVRSAEIDSTTYYKAFFETQGRLDQRVARDLHWFPRRPMVVRGIAIGIGVALILAGVAAGLALAFSLGLGLVGLAPIVVGIALILLNGRFVGRTADGTAVLAQARGFEQYLATAEADQIRFEESIDVFSRYLPYAIVFGVADRWAKVFQQLAAEGRYTPDTAWYVGPTPYFYAPGFAESIGHLGSDLGASFASSAATSAGGSGFSGGGGFGGGGGGGW